MHLHFVSPYSYLDSSPYKTTEKFGAGRGFNDRTRQLSRVTDKWRRFSISCSNFSVVLYGEESRYTPLDFRKRNLNHHFVSTARQNVSACLFSREYWSRSRGSFDGRSDSILQPCLKISLIHC